MRPASRWLRAAIAGVSIAAAALIAAAQPADPRPDDDDDEEEDDDLDAGSGSDAGPSTPPPAEGVDALDQKRTIRVGFDHLTHDRDLNVQNLDPIPCATCHPTRGKAELAGRPDHKACFGTCHGAAPARRKGVVEIGERAKVCAACHAPVDLVRASKGGKGKLAVAYPPYTIDRDFGMQMSHAAHVSAACTTCHAPAPKARPAAGKRTGPAVHARCVACHAGAAQPPMTTCATCHVPAFGSASGPTLLEQDTVLPLDFDHASHGKRAPQAACTACHAAIAATDRIELPRPKAADCASGDCHDGGAAFSVTVACTRCHHEQPTGWQVYRSDERFSHDKHVERIGAAPCTSCHKLAASGDAATIGHTACDDAQCHASSFMEREPKICGACHVGTEPWLPLTADQRPRDETEHGARMPHDRHPQPCATCHVLATGTRELRPPRGHKACTGKGCHAAGAGAVPKLADCDGCHRAGLVAARNRLRLDARWSARARFRHAPHQIDPRDGTAVACESCHAGVGDSKEMTDVPTPAKASCAGCHDGSTAFKVTGTGCPKCHGTSDQNGQRFQVK
jgi:c(7)-type cytochrome triheme protein